ncbi:hypothetical protein BJX70DRAFT_408388 [Aspergillus crustosus]
MLDKCKSVDTSPFIKKHDWLRLRRALYPFKKETLVTLSGTISGLQDNLNTSLQLLNSALISQQQALLQSLMMTTTSISLQTTRITSVVEQNEAQCGCAIIGPDFRRVVAPQTLNALCSRQELISTTWVKNNKSRIALSMPLSKYCTCRKPSYVGSSFTFSAFSGHAQDCPLHVNGEQAVAFSARYAFCNRLLGLSVNFMMTLTRGAGALSISPALQFHSVVPDDSSAFHLLRTINLGDDGRIRYLSDPQVSLLKLLREQKVAPTDRLVDGSTLLHVVASQLGFGFNTSTRSKMESCRQLILDLIEVGVPVAEKDIHGITALDICISCSAFDPFIGLFVGREYSISPMGPIRPTRQHNSRRIWFGRIPMKMLPIEMAILSRSPDALRDCLLSTEHTSSASKTRAPEFFPRLIVQCLGWKPGMNYLMESSLFDRGVDLEGCFRVACLQHDFESASLLLNYSSHVSISYLTWAVNTNNLKLVERKLRQLALNHLPMHILRTIELPVQGLLDAKSATTSLGLGGNERSVYGVIYGSIPAAELLYEAGFTDLTQPGPNGNPPLADLQFFHPKPRPVLELCQWMIAKGADLYQPSFKLYPAIFYLAESFGAFSCVNDYKNYFTPRTLDLYAPSQASDIKPAINLFTLLMDDTRDTCFCACSKGGCSPLSRVARTIRAWYLMYEPSPGARTKANCSALLRLFTFERLGLTHTCHRVHSRGATRLDNAEISEIREEEAEMIEELDQLVREFDRKYDELSLGLEEFTTEYWIPRMEEVLAEEVVDFEDARQTQDGFSP